MKLTLTIATAIATLLYAIVKFYVPDFPVTADDWLKLVVLFLTWLGITVTEEQLRAWFVRRGYKGFKK